MAVESSHPLIDCDLHAEVPTIRALFPYLAPHWVEEIQNTTFKGAQDSYYPKNAPTANRQDARSAEGPSGPSLADLRRHVLDPQALEYGIVNCTYAVDS